MKAIGFLLDFAGFLIGLGEAIAILYVEPSAIEAALRWVGL